MSAQNHCLLTGRVGKDPETRTTPSGTSCCKFTLAVNRGRKDPQGQWITDWFDVTLWGKAAEKAGEQVRKGLRVTVAGEMQIDVWNSREGQKQKTVVLSGDSFALLDHQEQQAQAEPAAAAPYQRPPVAPQPAPSTFFDDDDIPPF
jgi:single-strand DNA-binding protein